MNGRYPSPATIAAVGVAMPTLGVIVALWTGEWRWTASGIAAMFVVALVGVALDGRRR